MSIKKRHKYFNDYLKEVLKDPEMKAAYNAMQPEFAVIEAMIMARKKKKLIQTQYAKKSM
ncbi:MAG: hypothetical protein A2804_00340 [Candidatus Pacebacteria bacterium RIFCSPHIGHO2_01_FULL_46_10]|nr:MAG: hypothetical protein A2804_00340 [Candidatus Pacebacteria bacterium RIFCSPHIGHO2_01_FULL_46_10]